MKPKTMILMGLAIVCGLAASILTSQLLANMKKEVPVIVAKQQLKRYMPIREPEKMFDVASIEEKSLRDKAIRADDPRVGAAMANLKSWTVKTPVEVGKQVSWDDLLEPNKGNLDSMLDPGTLAMAVPISAVGAAGFSVLPGTHVNLIHTINGEAEVLMEDVKVLAIDMQTERPADKTGLVGASATLQLKPDQAIKVAGARERGSITMALRPAGELAKAPEEKVDTSIPLVPPPPPSPPEPAKTVPGPGTAGPVQEVTTQYLDVYQGSKMYRVEMKLVNKKLVERTIKTYDQLMNDRPPQQQQAAAPVREKTTADAPTVKIDGISPPNNPNNLNNLNNP